MDNVRKAIYSLLKEDFEKRPLQFFTVPKEKSDAALVFSAWRNNPTMAKLALKSGAGKEAREWALCVSATQAHTEIMNLLLDAGVDIHSNEDNALYQAVLADNVTSVELLLSRGADPDNAPESLIDLALSKGWKEIKDLLIKHKKSKGSSEEGIPK